jgi:arginine N-succinyltransferase
MRLPETVLRPVRESDLEAVTHLVGTIADGMTSLPKDPDFLRHRINDSLRAFDPRIHKPGGETYLFVLERLADQSIIGTSGLLSRVGGFDPFYTYTIRRHTTEYAPLDIHTELETLHLTKNHKGPTEICSLYLHRDHRSGGLGKLLSLSRFCFMKAFPDRFDEQVIAELRGYIDESGHPPFWEAVGEKFFQKDYYTADILSGVGEKDFIEALMPTYPIYISLLPESARNAIGRVHEHTEPAKTILLKEGFTVTDEVDIFDAGPILKAKRSSLNTWKNTRSLKLLPGTPDPASSRSALLTNLSLDFRGLVTEVSIGENDSITTSPEVINLLNLKPGDPALCLQL